MEICSLVYGYFFILSVQSDHLAPCLGLVSLQLVDNCQKSPLSLSLPFTMMLCSLTLQRELIIAIPTADLQFDWHGFSSLVMFFLKMGQPRPLFRLFLVFFKQTLLQFLQQINVKKCHVHPVYGTRIRTHDLWIVSLLP